MSGNIIRSFQERPMHSLPLSLTLVACLRKSNAANISQCGMLGQARSCFLFGLLAADVRKQKKDRIRFKINAKTKFPSIPFIKRYYLIIANL